MEQTEEKDRLGRQACDLANEVLALVHKAETPGTQTMALSLALGATLGGYATSAMALAQVLDLAMRQIGKQAAAHFQRRLQSGDAHLGIPGLDVAPADKGSLN